MSDIELDWDDPPFLDCNEEELFDLPPCELMEKAAAHGLQLHPGQH